MSDYGVKFYTLHRWELVMTDKLGIFHYKCKRCSKEETFTEAERNSSIDFSRTTCPVNFGKLSILDTLVK